MIEKKLHIGIVLYNRSVQITDTHSYGMAYPARFELEGTGKKLIKY
jgi:hypothetical protein